MVAVLGLIDYEEPAFLWKTNKADCGLLLIAFSLTLFLGVQTGIITAVVMSLVHQIYLSSRPHIAILGRIPGTVMYRNIARFPEAVTVPGIVVFRFDAPIFFGNVEYFKKVGSNGLAINVILRKYGRLKT
jgi:MFS superfamily sulfate permease-like transporter